ncbi:hypothetical protein SAMN02745172_02478 [Pseudoxanthobacter soli DSM 19599]|uniref:Transcriptional regulatory protein, C terminal n=1 Tax=Pseudoxanthobacter soli DSM 19599 TaxID=1123029 RepID=A0A1M7ZLS7_9HYPH|nr:hypothetical protein [Pseudoxanthobacter soli]SHO65831.1 hypothetical protein SAMN02745172_02478 [Pseudoxanthobacter soli DSM 19599]
MNAPLTAVVHAAASLCPCCNRPIPRDEVLLHMQRRQIVRGGIVLDLGPVAFPVAVVLLAAGVAGRHVTALELADVVYAGRPDGGPDDAGLSLRKTIWDLRQRLGTLRLVLEHLPSAGYRIVDREARS